jgi:hypothetical protein
MSARGMIRTDFMAGAYFESGNPKILLPAVMRLFRLMPPTLTLPMATCYVRGRRLSVKPIPLFSDAGYTIRFAPRPPFALANEHFAPSTVQAALLVITIYRQLFLSREDSPLLCIDLD